MDFCAYFRKIAEDPSQHAPPITVSDFLKARQHILVCESCSQLVDAVLEKAPEDSGPKIGLN